jgi:hypothetical protein
MGIEAMEANTPVAATTRANGPIFDFSQQEEQK